MEPLDSDTLIRLLVNIATHQLALTQDIRVDLLERLQDQQSALNDLTRQALATLHATLRTQQRTLDREIRMLDEGRSQTARHDAALAALLQRTLQHDEVLDRLTTTLEAIKDLLSRPNGP